jgi:hypothetical protein
MVQRKKLFCVSSHPTDRVARQGAKAKEDFRHGELNPGLLGPSCVAKNTV